MGNSRNAGGVRLIKKARAHHDRNDAVRRSENVVDMRAYFAKRQIENMCGREVRP